MNVGDTFVMTKEIAERARAILPSGSQSYKNFVNGIGKEWSIMMEGQWIRDYEGEQFAVSHRHNIKSYIMPKEALMKRCMKLTIITTPLDEEDEKAI